MNTEELFKAVAAPGSRKISPNEVAAEILAGNRVYGFDGSAILTVRSYDSALPLQFVWVGANSIPVAGRVLRLDPDL